MVVAVAEVWAFSHCWDCQFFALPANWLVTLADLDNLVCKGGIDDITGIHVQEDDVIRSPKTRSNPSSIP